MFRPMFVAFAALSLSMIAGCTSAVVGTGDPAPSSTTPGADSTGDSTEAPIGAAAQDVTSAHPPAKDPNAIPQGTIELTVDGDVLPDMRSDVTITKDQLLVKLASVSAKGEHETFYINVRRTGPGCETSNNGDSQSVYYSTGMMEDASILIFQPNIDMKCGLNITQADVKTGGYVSGTFDGLVSGVDNGSGSPPPAYSHIVKVRFNVRVNGLSN